ncbi:WD40-repeat-containing domain protein [Flagelloscypha sp. PMI_526]|nr:WD40-repeat-containing domain protein [Flagelloscypha sp. PMI_526]
MRIWDTESGRQLRKLDGHGGLVASVAFSPDGNRIVSGSHDRSMRIWDTESGRQLRKHDGHGDSVSSVAFSPDGKFVVSGSHDESVRIWNVESGKYLWDVPALVRSVSFCPPANFAIPYQEHFYHSILHLKYSSDQPLLSNFSQSNPSDSYTLHLSPTSSLVETCDDGWVVTSMKRTGVKHRIIWLPPSLRPYDPIFLVIISETGFNRIDLSRCVFGDGWTNIYVV